MAYTFLSPRIFSNAPSRSIQTVAAAANGWQLSAIRDAFVSYSATITTTASISAAANGAVVLQICPTNSALAVNWIEIARTSNGQTVSLAVALQSVQIQTGAVTGFIPAGYFVRLLSINISGTPTYSLASGQEVLQ